MAYPTLNDEPYPIKESRANSTISSEYDGGYEHTRARYTRVRKIFELTYQALSDADKILLENHIDTVNGAADSFDWTHPQTSVVYTVRFKEPPEFEYIAYNYWKTSFILKEV